MVFTERFEIQKEFTTLFKEMSPQEPNKCIQNSLFIVKKTRWPFDHLRAKIVIVGSNK